MTTKENEFLLTTPRDNEGKSIYSLEVVGGLLGLSRSGIRRLIAEEGFPEPFTYQCAGWREADVRSWMKNRSMKNLESHGDEK
ncbi:AlpA family phage regulatory protein [Pseudomonas aeruginosa]|uniref:helix-turn-helix transcriptional regulator n=1 Tax=Pseudomonas aeruginosa TaxID=287 RepID=UPI0009A44A52|nr:AlpA family phage regulatory protein [Pseudomonas aeruginosa]WMI73018.1 AlpA family phage regulatory protein [Pseudomonas aeruginosa]HCU0340798.1 AlpA family phage regulatory protein [Pseudomonas aeruginosa]